MDTVRVDICYRPLRIAWAIKSDDFDAFRKAVKYSHALWGGRFNPIIFVDQKEEETSQLIDLFRVDVIIPIGESEEVKEFPDKYPYLINYNHHGSIFLKGDEHCHPSSNVLDVHNALVYLRDKPEWKEIKEIDFYHYTWGDNDPLTDVFLSQFGVYPDKDEVGTDYLGIFQDATECTEITLDITKTIPIETIDHPSISYLSRYNIKQHYNIRSGGWKAPGFYVGSVGCLEDLVCHWNLRACDISLWFVDPQYIERYVGIIPAWEKAMRDNVSNFRNKFDRDIAVWSRSDDFEEVTKSFDEMSLMRCHVSDGLWNGRNVIAPMMYFGEATALGVKGGESNKPKVSFALTDKPFCSERWFYQQHLVASVSFIGGLYGDEQHTFEAPYVPELNKFYARTMHVEYDKLRVESERIGIIVDAVDHDSYLYALPVADLMERIFELAGYETVLSNAGLISKQLISKLGGIQGGRVFKIPGVRQLLKTHGFSSSVTKNTALQTIGAKSLIFPDSKFSDHNRLYIEPREYGTALTPVDVFGYLVEKGLFRIGSDQVCSSCKIKSWIPLESLKHKVTCDLCGHENDVTRNLTDVNEWHYRRSGILGVEKNAQGAIPVLLTLQQLDANLDSGFNKNLYSLSLDLTPKEGFSGNKCETDFVWIIPKPYPRKTVVILSECKDQGPITAEDISNLKAIADALPRKRFKTFILLSQITSFTDDEIELAKNINDDYKRRVIMLSGKELEPYLIGERDEKDSGKKLVWFSPEDMAESTARLYFSLDDVTGGEEKGE
ncbi:hypothetical protein MNBD_GAMMA07-1890 [hydrothermal vent metagenome]|uniref:Uncharacterized protein n=1 Tax=hydrothermal vent metagenome TaxID=652676 RepID=A0A3B0WHW2_9ZZZZ